ncbi:nucleic acid-binding protein [Haloferula helveola]|uniref:Nucleic acid-binding protein n=1 Tax=Haloferula helveola TaxID=490095 RepID=A0ABM7RI51_9BACT|nr:nucleic acid-binding protein [Haloferula helveola]
MLASIEGLLIVQDRDRKVQDLTQQLEKLPADEARARARLDGDQKAVGEAKAALQQNAVEAKTLDLDVQTRNTTITRLKQQQFETRKNDEFSALGHEIERYGNEVDSLETKQLELMESADELRSRLEGAQAALRKSEEVVEDDLKSIAARRSNIEAEIEETKRLRGEAAAKVDEELLSLYERLLKKKGGVAVAPVHSGQCGGCHVKLIPATLIKVGGAAEVVQCENCGRILYLED